MSRSYRKTPIFGWTNAKSDKYDKTKANRRIRRVPQNEIPIINLLSNPATFQKDGKQYWPEATKKDLAK